ncbi:MAG TPA: hypothetical protein VNN73_15685 [Blastocatellia bacterium]|nr:hypothetical protein [Blastocatellia bacterium]
MKQVGESFEGRVMIIDSRQDVKSDTETRRRGDAAINDQSSLLAGAARR